MINTSTQGDALRKTYIGVGEKPRGTGEGFDMSYGSNPFNQLL